MRTVWINICPGPSAIATVLLSSTSTAISWPRVSMLLAWKVLWWGSVSYA